MSTTPILGITELAASQSQPEVPVNTALRILEAMSPLSVIDRVTSTPPIGPAEGDRYIIPSGSTGVWAGHDFAIALCIGGTWTYLTPRVGWLAYVDAEDVYVKYASGSPSGWEVYP